MTINIGFISDAVFPWHVGGVEKTEKIEAEELAKNKNYKVSFICGRWKGMQKTFKDGNIYYNTIMKIDDSKFYKNGRRSIITSIFYAINTFKIFRYRFDLVEVNFFPILHLPIVRLYSKITGCKLVLDVAEVWNKDYWINYLGAFFGRMGYYYMKFSLKMADAYIINSSITANEAIKLGIKKDKINIYSPIIDDKKMLRIKNSIRKKEKRIIYAGRFIKEKRLDIFVDVINKLYQKNKNIKAELIGSGPEEKNIKTRIYDLNLENVIRVKKPYKNQKDIFYEIAKSYVTFLPSEREGLSALSIESIALNTPVVLPNYTPIPKEVKEMCIVESVEKIPDILNRILLDEKPENYIKNKENLKYFSISKIDTFYSKLFTDLKIKI